MTLGTFYNHKQMRMIDVLIADDHAIVRRGLRTLIAGEPDMEVAGEASDGYEVVMRARDLHPDVILMDVALGEMDGWQATRLIKADVRTSNIPIIALTASAMKGDEQRMRAGGCSGYVAKPIRYQTLLQAIDEVLAQDKDSARQN